MKAGAPVKPKTLHTHRAVIWAEATSLFCFCPRSPWEAWQKESRGSVNPVFESSSASFLLGDPGLVACPL